MKNWFSHIVAFTLAALVVLAVGLAIGYYMINDSVPVYKGEVDADRLAAPVEIYHDSYAIPYIYAKNEEDAAFALGYTHAQERLFQMDLIRRAGQGRLSEVCGEKTLPYDKMFITIGIEDAAWQEYKQLNPATKKILEAYSAGVNQFIKGKHLPLEFDAMGYEPEMWRPEESVLVSKMVGWALNISWWTDMAFTNLVQKIGEQKVKEILPDFKENAPTEIPADIKNMPEVSQDIVQTDRDFRSFIGFKGTHIGSNNWAVSPSMSSSGKAIIANDPHLAYSAPGIWYAAVINGGSWHAQGVTIPGIPGVIIGKNDHIAWTVTNVMADEADFYNEQLDKSKTKYFYNGSWQYLKIKKYRIKVRNGVEAEVTVKQSHHGPLISEIHPYATVFKNKYNNKANISMRWLGTEPGAEITGIMEINKASNWNQFKEGAGKISMPGQNFVYADASGNIGYICAAKIPLRNSENSTFVFDGTQPKNDWRGYVPFEEMPQLFNPEQHYIATANNKVESDFPHHITNLWEPSSRIDRIKQLMESKQKHSVDDFKGYQMDQQSPYVKEIVQYIFEAFKTHKATNKNVVMALSQLHDWNCELDKYSQMPAIYETFFQQLLKNIFMDEMGQTLFEEYIFAANIPFRTVEKMLKDNNSSWFDDVRTSHKEGRDEIVRRSFYDAINTLQKNYGMDIAMWQWGNMHTVTFKHLFHGYSRVTDQFLDLGPFGTGGDGTTVCNGEYEFSNPYESVLGPSMRFLYDFAKPDEFYLTLTTGESGHPVSKHYRDMVHFWLEGNYITVKSNESYVRNAGYDLLILK
jgi:penicillin amidase